MPRRNSVNRNEVMDMLRREGMYIIETRDDVNKMLDVMARFYADDGRYKDISAFAWLEMNYLPVTDGNSMTQNCSSILC